MVLTFLLSVSKQLTEPEQQCNGGDNTCVKGGLICPYIHIFVASLVKDIKIKMQRN